MSEKNTFQGTSAGTGPPLATSPEREVLSVSQLNRQVRQLLETHLPLIWVEGEISNFSRPSSGHWYFTLKDSGAQVRCAMFRNRNQLLRQTPRHGQQVVVRARVGLYEGRGDYQLIVEHLEDTGFGALQRAFEALKKKLLDEGLFDTAIKKPLPAFPRHLGVITSPTGAALRDILHVLSRRFPALPASVFPVAVQGQDAARQIVKAIEDANRLSDCDLLILARGGGSLEDLWPFNEEIVARAVHASRLPIVSGVGHETDFSIVDFAADHRAPTPSAAAELCTPDGSGLNNSFLGYRQLLTKIMTTLLRERRQRLNGASGRLQHPAERLQARAQHLDNLEIRLQKALRVRLAGSASRLQLLQQRYMRLSPLPQIERRRQLIEQLGRRLQTSVRQQLSDRCRALGKQSALLDSVNPLRILKRGYSVTSDSHGRLVRSHADVNPGDQLLTRLADGELYSVVSDSKGIDS